ncbi:MAG: S53 family peptidase, partial [Acidimicrobiales bacterium]
PLVTVAQGARLPAAARVVRAAPGRSLLHLDVMLRGRDPAGLAGFVEAVSTPGDPLYHHFLARGELAGRFGASAAEVSGVESSLRAAGLHPGRLGPDGLDLHVTASAASAEAAFHTSLAEVRDGARVSVANLTPVMLAPSLAGKVTGVVGLDGLGAWRPHYSPPASAPLSRSLATRSPATRSPATRSLATRSLATRSPATSSTPSCTGSPSTYPGPWAALYDLGPIYSSGDLGAGASIGIYELSGWSAGDVAHFESACGLANTVNDVPVDGGASPDGSTTEPIVDIDTAALVAPHATLDVYTGPNSGSTPLHVLQAMVSQDRDKVLSISWGACEAYLGDAELAAEQTYYEQAAAQGQSVFAASGDNGSTDCVGSNGSTAAAVDDPASQPDVTGVGGTVLSGASEQAWSGSGGGLSSYFARPSYQAGSGRRQVPDVSADAQSTGYYCTTGGCLNGGGGWASVGGTSIAAPFWAAVAGLADSRCTTPLGLVSPRLYQLRAGPSSPFHDITTGGNGGWSAGPGYDMVSGLGTPDAALLVGDLCGALSSPGSSGPGGSGRGAGLGSGGGSPPAGSPGGGGSAPPGGSGSGSVGSAPKRPVAGPGGGSAPVGSAPSAPTPDGRGYWEV